MSWVKKVWNRLFTEDTEEVTVEPLRQTDLAEAKQPKKAPFRFPLISDTEKDKLVGKENTAPVSAAPKRRPSSPALNKARRYEPVQDHAYVPREENPLPPVQENQTYIAPPRPRTYSAPVTRESKPTIAPRPYRPRNYDTPKLPRSRVNEPVLKKTRPFEPSRVPSPIHGYNESRPEPIMNLLEKRQPINEQPNLASLASAKEASLATQKLPSITIEAQEKTAPSVQPISKSIKIEEVHEAEPVIVETSIPEEAADNLKEALKDPLSVENPPVFDSSFGQIEKEAEKEAAGAEMLEEAVKEQPAVKAAEEHRVFEEAEKETETPRVRAEEAVIKKPEQKKEKTVPFNVLMLKSDKSRLKPAAPATQPISGQKPERKVHVDKQMMSDIEMPKQPEAPESVEPAVYQQPKSGFLRPPENDLIDEAWMEEQGERLIEALSHFQIQASILSIVQGPAVTQFEVTVAQGVKVSKIRNLADDLKLALAAKDIRIQAPIPGKSSIGIEIPNRTSRAVRISEVIESRVFQESESPLEAALGLDLTGKPVTLDLRKMPHGLIAGATGSGKSVCINSILVSLLYKSSPQDLKMLLIDPKMVELAPYNHIPHLISPVITDVKAATASLKWAVEEMERRYQLFAHIGVRDLSRYNKLVKEKGDHAQHLPYILIVIDELADLMMMSPSDVEDAICRIAQKARACGIHLVIATQRPSVDVITGLIKSNIPTRIAFSVSSQVDSRTILDSQGAERLLGRGDMLYLGNGMSAPVRIQGTFVTDEEIEDVIAHVRSQGEPEYFFQEDELIRRNDVTDVQDDLFEEACRFIISQGSASTSLLQRKFHIGYNRAARLMDLIEQHGFISEQNGSKARAVLITEEDMESVFQ